ncbi:hypothetical protein [Cyclobacterium jeungdonense]|uniref:Uncharacterized protein n=1 Tax=Cyclobacterium jeungdonense TaxID=708087 RepID=A0ABT8C621_9BACT|nr:hypothetical protein [Cyclobacterium jeungdonense]MDN3688196.1 hypothetical protein [Cyclobacterium jeungdonense]
MMGSTNKAEKSLSRSFLAGLAGILFCMVPLVLLAWQLPGTAYGSYFTGIGLALQLLGISLAVLVLRARNLDATQKEKAKKMVLVLGVAFLFFVLV